MGKLDKWSVVLIYFSSEFLLQSLCDKADGGKAPRLPLNDGHSIPTIGIGTFLGFDENGQKPAKEGEVEMPVTWALNSGYRMIDTAQAYKNEEQVGLAVRKSSVPRESIFVVTKPDESKYDIVDYLDTWRGMEEAKTLGLTKSIGISNFNVSQFERLLANCNIKPAVLQIEVNLNLAQNRLIDFSNHHGVVVMAYTPFGSLFSPASDPAPPPKSDDPALVKMATKYGKTTPQVVLRYLVQRGLAPIPKSTRKTKVEENIDIFDFEVTAEEMATLSDYNKDYRTVLPSFWQDHPYYPFEQTDKPGVDLFKG